MVSCNARSAYISSPSHEFTHTVENTELLVNATRRAINKFSANVSAFVIENTRIIGEIDVIIASLGDIHTRINMVSLFSLG